MAAVTIMAAFSCGKEIELVEVQPEGNTTVEQSSTVFTYSVSIDASKGADSKALTLEGNTLNATWAIGEAVTVYNETKGEALTGTLIAQSSGASTTLKGDLTGSKGIAEGDALTLKFLSPNYSSQDGTLEHIAANCDYATASVTVTSVNGSDIRTGTANFVNQQAIVHFELSMPNGYYGLYTRSVKFVVDKQIITVTLSSENKDVYIAVPAISAKTIIIGASSYPEGDSYYYVNSSASFTSGQYYSIRVTMKSGVVVFNETELNSAISANKPYIVLGCDIQPSNYIQVNGGKNITLDLGGNSLNRNLTSLVANGSVIKVFSGNTLTVKDSGTGGMIKGGRATDGGGICNEGTLYFQGGTITDCLADSVTSGYGRGGAIYNHGTMVMSGGTLLGCWGKDCGGVWSDGNLTITGGTITGNTSNAGGGGVVNYATATITGGNIYNNTATTRGGGVWNGSTLTLDGTSATVNITGNTCSIDGGGVWNGGTVYIQGTVNVNGNHKNSWDSNFFCTDGKFITVTGSLGSSRIGVSHEGNAGTMTSGYAANNAVTNHFDNDFTEIANLGLTGGEAVLTLRTDGVYYIERGWDSTNHKVTETMHFISSGYYTELKGALSAFPHVAVETYGNEWLVVKDSGVTRNRIIVAPGKTLNIIMCDGSSLTSQITVEAGQTVNIFGQLQDSGFLNADSDDAFDTGIGAYKDADAGTINIHGGKIEAIGSTSGIGGVEGGHHSGTINIYGGIIDAYGSKNSAAIGGAEDSTGGTINIYGGKVTALAYHEGAGIGSGQDGAGMSINIHGGTITARSNERGAGIGGGDNAVGGNITITGGTINAYSGKDADLNIATGDGAGIGGGEDADGGVINISGGVVNATSNGYGAGIGGGQDGLGGTITITGGTVYAHGGEDAAGIGCGENTGGRTEDGGSITISGGTVYAYGNHDSDTCGAGIGGGQDASGGNITISGGYVRAYGGNNAAGIGSGEETTTGPNINGGTITITGGDVSGIGQDGGAGIGAGAGASAGYISITGGIVEGHGGNDSSAICSHDTEHDPNIVYVGDYMRVHAGSNFFAAADRLYYFWNARDVHAEPCTHNGNPCTWCMYGH